jgi:S-adenosylmethionine synthetase
MPAVRPRPDAAPIYYSHKILELLADARHQNNGEAGKLGPDAKSQVTVRYENGAAAEVTQIVLSTQHMDASWDSKKVRKVVEPYIRDALGELKIADNCNWYINPTGKFVIGGLMATRLTGRKIIVDTYGGAAPTAAAHSPARTPRRSIARGLCGALPCQECRRGQTRRPLHDPVVLCHRRGAAAVDLYRPARHGLGGRGEAGAGDP